MDCPFCHDVDFDDIGLKTHILSDCEKFRLTHTAPRFFDKSLQDKLEELINDTYLAIDGTNSKESACDILRDFAERVRAL